MKITRFAIFAWAIIASLILAIVSITYYGEDSHIAGSTSVNDDSDIAASLSDSFSPQNVASLLSIETGRTGITAPNDPFYDKQWALNQIDLAYLRNNELDTNEIIIAILDTGIDRDHEDLKDKVIAEVNLTAGPSVNDLNGHGTHIAGTIAANTDNGIGIAGLASPVTLMNVKVADDYGTCQPETVASGIVWAVDNGANIINISLEITHPSAELEKAVDYAWDNGVLIVAAAGNQGNDAPVYPAYYENSLAVAATRPDGTLAPLSNYGSWVDVAAPGYKILSTLPGDQYGFETGTSFAAAFITGLAADLFTIVSDTNNDGKLNDDVRQVIESSCYRTDYTGLIAWK